MVDARVTGGFGAGSSDGKGYTNTTLVDINGDGIQDSVIQNGEQIYIYLCKYDKNTRANFYKKFLRFYLLFI